MPPLALTIRPDSAAWPPRSLKAGGIHPSWMEALRRQPAAFYAGAITTDKLIACEVSLL